MHMYVLKLQYSTAFTVNNGHERKGEGSTLRLSTVSVKTEQKNISKIHFHVILCHLLYVCLVTKLQTKLF